MKLYISLFFLFLSAVLSANPVHTVKEGETLLDIAAMYDTTPLELSVANSIDMTSELKEGQKILIVRLSDEEILNNISSDGKTEKTPSKNTKHKTEKKAKNTGKSGNALVNFALKLKNTPYISGGTSRGGFDCSGFTYYVYRSIGKTIPRSSAAQYTGGKKIAKKDLQKGDIVCFSIHRSGCSHVGIYIGNGKFIHAANSKKGVVVSDLSSSYYKNKFIGGRRY